MEKKDYKKRLVDDKISKYLEIFGALSIEGPKCCGKTWTSLNHSKSSIFLTNKQNKDLALSSPKYIFTEEFPQLIDEWQVVPAVWDAVRHACDENKIKGKFILTGSNSIFNTSEGKDIYHSGTGRIITIRMYTMSLYESGDSNGKVSIMQMFNDTAKLGFNKEVTLYDISKLIVRGGWPENINSKEENINIIPKEYLESIINKDITQLGLNRINRDKMRMIIKSLSRNISSTIKIDTIINDINENENSSDIVTSRITVDKYINLLDNMYMTLYQNPFSLNYRSSSRVGKSLKRHFVDPSLACASLEISDKELLNDFNTFGLLFESLAIRDLSIYMDYIGGKVSHFRDNASGDEVDAILEFSNGEYAAIEIKLTTTYLEDAKKNLTKFYTYAKKKPKFMCIIVGEYSAITKDEQTGIYVVPLTALKP